jgi:DNA-binding PadR family transcriptional regulator
MPRKNLDKAGRLTDLESCVLAIVGRAGACTAYAVRKSLGRSLSSYWSGSAGAIYPLLDKLSRSGWLTFEEQPFGKRRRRSYRLSAKGRRQLRRWLMAPVPAEAAAHTHDPLRVRVFFLGMIPAEQRRAFLQDAVARTADVLCAHRLDRDRKQEELSEWDLRGREGAIRELEARLDWLQEVLASV